MADVVDSTRTDHKASESSSSTTTVDHPDSPYYLHPSDDPAEVLVSDPLNNGDNYSTWCRAVSMALTAKNKLGFVDGSLPQPDASSSSYDAWSRCNDMVLSWLLNSISHNLRDAVVYAAADTAFAVWNDLRECFSSTRANATKIYQIRRAIARHRQEQMSVAAYFTRLEALWDELTSFLILPNSCSCEAMKSVVDLRQQEKLMQFLMGLDDSYSAIRSQILLMNPLPTVNEAYNLVLQEEHQRSVLIAAPDSVQVPSPALASDSALVPDPTPDSAPALTPDPAPAPDSAPVPAPDSSPVLPAPAPAPAPAPGSSPVSAPDPAPNSAPPLAPDLAPAPDSAIEGTIVFAVADAVTDSILTVVAAQHQPTYNCGIQTKPRMERPRCDLCGVLGHTKARCDTFTSIENPSYIHLTEDEGDLSLKQRLISCVGMEEAEEGDEYYYSLSGESEGIDDGVGEEEGIGNRYGEGEGIGEADGDDEVEGIGKGEGEGDGEVEGEGIIGGEDNDEAIGNGDWEGGGIGNGEGIGEADGNNEVEGTGKGEGEGDGDVEGEDMGSEDNNEGIGEDDDYGWGNDEGDGEVKGVDMGGEDEDIGGIGEDDVDMGGEDEDIGGIGEDDDYYRYSNDEGDGESEGGFSFSPAPSFASAQDSSSFTYSSASSFSSLSSSPGPSAYDIRDRALQSEYEEIPSRRWFTPSFGWTPSPVRGEGGVTRPIESSGNWKERLPPGYKEILKRAVVRVKFSSYEDLYDLLCNSILIDDGKKSFALERSTGKKCFMLSGELVVTWGKDLSCWKWKSLPESRFSKVAELLNVSWLDIRGQIDAAALSPGTTYAAYLVFKLSKNSYGLCGYQESEVSVGAQTSRHSVCLQPTEYMLQHRSGMLQSLTRFPNQRNDGWMEMELGEFFVGGDNERNKDEIVHMSLMEVKRLNRKGGLIIEGIEVRPKEIE